MKKYIFYQLVIITFLSCSKKIPTYELHILNEIPDNWNTKINTSKKLNEDWWKIFNDSLLNISYDNFIKKNPDFISIVNQLNISKEIAKIDGAIIYPTLSISNSVNQSQRNLASFGIPESLSNIVSPSNEDNATSFESVNYGLNLSMQWELDLWGKLLNARKAAHSQNIATIYDLKYLEFSLKTQFVKIFYQTVQAYNQYQLAQQSNESLLNIRNFVSARYKQGLRTSIDLRLAESSLSSNKILLENKKKQYKILIRNLQALMGEYPSGEMNITSKLPSNLPEIPSSLPIHLVERRPDIQSRLKELESAGYKFAQSKRNRLPSIYFTTSGGTSTDELKEILNGDYSIWNLAANLTAPIFQAGKIKSNIKINENSLELAKSNYVKKILIAFSEVETLLFNDNSLKKQYQEIVNNEIQSFETYKIAMDRYKSGILDLLTVLNLQQQWINAKSQRINIEYQKIDSRLNLLLALGGDFNVNIN